MAGTWASGSPASIYLDGVLVATSSSVFSGTIRYDASFPISIGADFDPNPGLGWRGNIDDVRIYGHALSNAEVQGLVLGETTIEVAIDIKPGSFPNSINPGSKGVIAVAVLTTDTFDATTVNETTVLFGASGGEAAPVHAALEDVDEDGDTDMILHFNTQDTGIECGDTSASLTGQSVGGQTIHGSDSIRTVGCK